MPEHRPYTMESFDRVRDSISVRLVGWFFVAITVVGGIPAVLMGEFGFWDVILLIVTTLIPGIGLIRRRRWAYVVAVVSVVYQIGAGIVTSLEPSPYRWVPLVYGVAFGSVFLAMLLLPWIGARSR